MSRTLDLGQSLSFSEKCQRLGERLRDPEWRKFGRTLILGKLAGLGVTLALMLFILPFLLHFSQAFFASKPAFAQEASQVAAATAPAAAAPASAPADPLAAFKGGDLINPLNTVWTLVAAFLVFGMQAGFTMLEAGFCRSRETVNVLVECVFDTCLCGLLFWAWGYAFMFGAGNGFIGWHDPNDPTATWFFLQGGAAAALYGSTGVPVLAHWIFQFAFADCASTICSGSMVGRTGFWGDIVYSVGVSGFIYPIVGHWAWGPDGFLATMGSAGHFLPGMTTFFHDFAGSTVVHTIGGTIALAGAICLGPRLGRKFKRDGGGPMMPHDITIAVVGGFILWFGWYGFNPGSTLNAMDFKGISRIAANTTLAACAGGMVAEIFVYFRTKKWDPGAITNGFLAGLVAITCPCYWVSPLGSVLLGGVSGIVVVLGTDLLEYLRIDDPIGAVPVHMMNGIWGTISLGLFATGEYGITGQTGMDTSSTTGLFYGNHDWHLLAAQVVGNATITIATFLAAMAMFKALDMIGILRISKQGEIEGMDLHEHGISAYPEYVITSWAAPASMSTSNVNALGGERDMVSSGKH